MKPQYINNGLEPPSKRELEGDDFQQSQLKYVRALYKPEEVFDLYEHDKSVSFPFAEYLSYHYVTVRTEEGYRHKRGGEYYTTNQVWDEYCNNKQLK